MTRTSAQQVARAQGRTVVPGRRAAPPPSWVARFLGPVVVRRSFASAAGTAVELARGIDHALITVRAPRAVALDAGALREATADAYAQVGRVLRELGEDENGPAQPVRFWNHVPGILDDMGDGQNRYMAFNAGRFAAFTTWYGDVEAFDRRVATASGVGHDGEDLVVHCLTGRGSGVAVSNPRQVAPHRYSRRYGPLPPCFARATVLPASGQLLVGGTASVVGEESLHAGDLDAQVTETLVNLAAIVDAAHGRSAGILASPDALEAFTELRAYHPRPQDKPALKRVLGPAFPRIERIEFVAADLCRSELLVEIEGVANVGQQV